MDTNDWWLAMLCGMHNHDLDEKLSEHLIPGRLSAEEKKKVIDMTKSLKVPRNILTNLKQNNKESVTTIKQVYNVRTRWRKGERGNMTELQYLISKLVEHKYVYYTGCNSNKTTLEDIFFAHSQLNCSTLFRPFWSWTPFTKQQLPNAVVGDSWLHVYKNDVFCWFRLSSL